MGRLKEDGAAGLLYAINANGEVVPARNGVSGEKYSCPVCNCSVHLRVTQSGKHIFVRYPGSQHTDGRCISYEAMPKKHTFDNVDPEKFILSLCRRVPEKNKAVHESKESTENHAHVSSDEDDIKTLNFTSLKQIYNEIDFLDGSITQGNYKISDYVVTHKSFLQVFHDKGIDLRARIIHCRYSGFDAKHNALLFDVFDKKQRVFVRFSLLFTKKEDFIKYRDKFGEFRRAENNTVKFYKLHEAQDVLLACDEWAFIGNQNCKNNCQKDSSCEKCRGMYQAVFTNSKQIFLIPADY